MSTNPPRPSRHRTVLSLTLAAGTLALGSCGPSEPEYAPERGSSSAAPAPQQDTPPPERVERTPEPVEVAPEPEPEPEPVAVEDDGRIPDHVRERPLVEDLGTRSLLGRTRDRARDVRDQIEGGLETSPLAITNTEDEYVQIANVHWDTPEGWRIAIPQDPDVLEEVVVPSPNFGTGRILFTRTEDSRFEIVSAWEARVLDETGSPSKAISHPYDAGDYAGEVLTIRGTYVADGRDHPFYMIAMILMPLDDGTRIVGTYIAPEDTQDENRQKWEQFLDSVKVK